MKSQPEAMNDDCFDADDFIRMRGLLRSMTGYFKDVMENGIPKPPPRRAGMDAKSADMEWHECRWCEIREAEQFLSDTEAAADQALGISLRPTTAQ